MAHTPDKRELRKLTSFNQPFCLTIYAPFIQTEGQSGSTDPNVIALKNLLNSGEEALRSAKLPEHEAGKAVRPGRALLEDNSNYWPFQEQGLALFMHHTGFFRCYTFPAGAFDSRVTVGKGFDLGPLQQTVDANQRYLVLALSHKNTRLYVGNQYAIKPVPMESLPSNMEETLGIDEYPESIQNHPVESVRGSIRSGKQYEGFHGQYNERETDKNLLLKFFRKIDTALRPLVQTEKLPLILAGTENLIPLYRQANTYQNLQDKYLRGNYDRADLKKLRQQAWSIIRGR